MDFLMIFFLGGGGGGFVDNMLGERKKELLSLTILSKCTVQQIISFFPLRYAKASLWLHF